MFRFRKPQPKCITFLECYSYTGCIYRVTGRSAGKSMRYRVEIGREPCIFLLAEYTNLSEADTLALRLLDNGAEPGDFLRQQPMI